MAESGNMVRRANGTFVAGQSGNPAGRPKGSKNKITEIKLLTEQAVRSGNLEDMIAVCQQIIGKAMEGDARAEKMVWDAMMSKASSTEDKAAGTKQKIEIGVMNVDQPNVIEGEVVNTIEDISNEQREAD
jgi:hypothetical protein